MPIPVPIPEVSLDETRNIIRMFNRAKHIYDLKSNSDISNLIDQALETDTDIPIDHPILNSIKGAALNDIFRSPQKSLRHGGPVTRSVIVRNGLEKGIESRKSLGIDKRKSGESSIKERRSLISVFS